MASVSMLRKFLKSSALHRQSRRWKICPSTCPLPCKPCCLVIRPPKEKCETLRQPVWEGCDKICLPCCEKLCVPQNCAGYTITLPTCRKIEYPLPSYSECYKDLAYRKRPKECCHGENICHTGSVASQELKPLITIKKRQRMALSQFRVK